MKIPTASRGSNKTLRGRSYSEPKIVLVPQNTREYSQHYFGRKFRKETAAGCGTIWFLRVGGSCEKRAPNPQIFSASRFVVVKARWDNYLRRRKINHKSNLVRTQQSNGSSRCVGSRHDRPTLRSKTEAAVCGSYRNVAAVAIRRNRFVGSESQHVGLGRGFPPTLKINRVEP